MPGSHRVSIVIPSYRDPKALPKTLGALLKGGVNGCEVIVVIDEPSEEALRRLSEYNGRLKLIVNKTRVGKVNAYRRALEEASGEYLIFLDDDVEVSDGRFVEKVVEALGDADIVDIKKVIKRNGWVSRLVYYDYLALNFVNYMFSKFVGRCVGVNGAAFAMRREAFKKVGGFRRILCEDMDLATRAYVKGLRFKFLNDVSVTNLAPKSWRAWFKQRKRWAIGAGVWISVYFRELVRIVAKNPRICLLTLLMLFPSLLSLTAEFLLEKSIVYKLLILLFFSLSSLHPSLMPVFTLISYSLAFLPLKTLIVSLLGFLGYAALYRYAGGKLGMKVRLLDFAIYYFVYSPIWLLILLAGIFRVLVLRRSDVEDWVV